MADLSAAEGTSDETDKAQAESEPIYAEIAEIKVEASDEAKAVPEKKRGFKIKTPNFKGFFKRSTESKASKQKSSEEKPVEDKSPIEDKVTPS